MGTGMLRGGLFTRYFLDDGIRAMAQYRRVAAAEVDAVAAAIRAYWERLERMPHPSEAETEAEFIFQSSACLIGNTCHSRSRGAAAMTSPTRCCSPTRRRARISHSR
jgi:hypothetical protein